MIVVPGRDFRGKAGDSCGRRIDDAKRHDLQSGRSFEPPTVVQAARNGQEQGEIE